MYIQSCFLYHIYPRLLMKFKISSKSDAPQGAGAESPPFVTSLVSSSFLALLTASSITPFIHAVESSVADFVKSIETQV